MTRRTKVWLAVLLAAVAAATVAFVVVGETSTEAASSPRERFLAKVATELGVKVEDLVAAFDKARLEMMDEAVAAGRITEEQAQAMKERIESRQALRAVFEQAIRDGKITRDQLALLRGRAGGPAGRLGAMPRACGFLERMAMRKCR